ncbi:MAG: hypothetical protein LBS00_04290 [Synergistaceae bacterium]|nr:hypothetical protein [Synergistaceae bacterium]
MPAVGYGNGSQNTMTAVGPGTTGILVRDNTTGSTAAYIVMVTSGGAAPTPTPGPEPTQESVPPHSEPR